MTYEYVTVFSPDKTFLVSHEEVEKFGGIKAFFSRKFIIKWWFYGEEGGQQ